jgi:tRNA pseudouridine55 synthase
MDGILLIDKPSGWTSFDVVAKVRSVLRTEIRKQEIENSKTSSKLVPNSSLLVTPSKKVKVGHTGTLDPLATGLLIIVVGSYCKRAGEFSKLDKVYEVTMKLGQTSTTGDEEGEKTVTSQQVASQQEVEKALKKFKGDIMQIPPIYSAIKVDGQRAYKLARAGKEVKLEPRPVKIYSIQLTAYSYPEVKFTAKVSSGTYIRSLVEDIGKELGTGAYMSALRRTEVGKFKLSDAAGITEKDDLTKEIKSL